MKMKNNFNIQWTYINYHINNNNNNNNNNNINNSNKIIHN